MMALLLRLHGLPPKGLEDRSEKTLVEGARDGW